MKIFITGGAGTLGANIVSRLSKQGIEVAVLDNFSTGSSERLGLIENLTVFDGSVTDYEFLYQALLGFKPTIVINSAASYADPNDWMSDINTNIVGAVNLVQACQDLHIENILNFQTALCYGNPISSPIDINHQLAPEGSYAISKVAAEHYLFNSDLNVISLRIANVASPFLSIGPIPTFYKRLTSGQGCFCTDARRDFLSFRDFVKLIDVILKSDFQSGIYNASTGKGNSIHDVYIAVSNYLGLDSSNVEVRPCGEDDVQEVILDPSETKKKFNWTAKDNFETVISDQLDWYKENGVGEIYSHLKSG